MSDHPFESLSSSQGFFFKEFFLTSVAFGLLIRNQNLNLSKAALGHIQSMVLMSHIKSAIQFLKLFSLASIFIILLFNLRPQIN